MGKIKSHIQFCKHFYACLNPIPGFPTSYVMFLFVFSEFSKDQRRLFIVDISGIEDNHCLYFPFIMKKYMARLRAIQAKKSPCGAWLGFLIGQKRTSSCHVILKSCPTYFCHMSFMKMSISRLLKSIVSF